jgi:hypothetical protein
MPTGGCLCGAVRYEIDGRISPIWFCHCSKCRRARGSAFHAGAACRRKRFRFLQGEEAIAEYRMPSGYATRFCRTCGSPAPSFPEHTDLVTFPVGTLDGDPGSRPQRHIFVASKAPWYEIRDELQQFAEQAPLPGAAV